MGGHSHSLHSVSDLAVLLPPSLLSHTSFLPVPAVSPGLELCDPTQRLRVALAGELVGVGGHFLFLGLALVSKDWRFLQRMITAPCILFLFYGSVSPFICHLAIPVSPSSLALAWRPPSSPLPLVRACPSFSPSEEVVSHPWVGRWEDSQYTSAAPHTQLAWSVSGVCTVADSETTD